MGQWERMLEGKLYSCNVSDERRDRINAARIKFMDEFNATSYGENARREELVRNIFENVGKNCCIHKPFHCDYGCNISVGYNFFANYDCIILDENKVKIGNNVMFGPRVAIFTAGHPIDKDVRAALLEYGYEVSIGDDVWIGGNTVVNPGVKIGSNVVIGSNSVVTKDIPDGVLAAGNPCKIIRKITAEDKKYWDEQAKEFYQDLEKSEM